MQVGIKFSSQLSTHISARNRWGACPANSLTDSAVEPADTSAVRIGQAGTGARVRAGKKT
jgi:hypothetical protein